ncbi:MAG: internal scaffolding protein [Microvirus sp.]|nr:MAG: internal scaffolding protein [Microvirus sp.]
MQTKPNQTPNLPLTPNNQTLIITAYGPKLPEALTSIHFPPDGLTKQEFKDECDINWILRNYEKTGQLPAMYDPSQAQYGEVLGLDYLEAQNLIANANSMFATLPSAIRNRFDNDPAKFLDFTADEKHLPEMAEMGLLRPDYALPAPPPPKAESAAPAAPTPAPAAPAK